MKTGMICRGVTISLMHLILFGLITWKAFETIRDYEENFGKDDGTQGARIACIFMPAIIFVIGTCPLINYFKK